MHRLSFSQKLWLPLVVSLIALLVVSVSAAWLSRQTRIEERKNDLVNVAHVGLSIVTEYAALAQSGTLSEAAAREQALERLRHSAMGKTAISRDRFETAMIMHAMKPALNGKDLSSVADADGRHHYVTFASVAQTPEGGFVDYVFPHPHDAAASAVDKIGYVVRYAPWDWIIATGAYVDDIDSAFRQSLFVVGGIFAGLAALLSTLVFFTNRSIRRAIGGDPAYAAQVAGEIEVGNPASKSGHVRATTPACYTRCSACAMRLQGRSHGSGTPRDKVATGAQEIAGGNTDLSARTRIRRQPLRRLPPAWSK